MEREQNRALARAIWDLGPLHLTPSFRAGAGYDSNAILVGDSRNPDTLSTVASGLDVALPVRDRLLLKVYEELDLVHYRELEELRDAFNVTRVGGAFGGKSFVMRADTEWREQKVRPSREIDIPVDQSSTITQASADFALGSRHELIFDYLRNQVVVAETDYEVRGTPIKSLLDRVEQTIGLNFTRHLTLDTAVFVEGFWGTQVFADQAVGRDATTRGILGGFTFSPTGNVNGEARVGIKRLIPESVTQPGFDGVIAGSDLRVGLGQRLSLRARVTRDIAPSVLRENLYYVANLFRADLGIDLGPRFTLRPGIGFGKNDYPASSETDASIPDVAVLIRRHREFYLDFDTRLTTSWLIRVEGIYSFRDTSSSSVPEERFRMNVGLTTTF